MPEDWLAEVVLNLMAGKFAVDRILLLLLSRILRRRSIHRLLRRYIIETIPVSVFHLTPEETNH